MQPRLLRDSKGILYSAWIKGDLTFLSKSADEGTTWERKAISSGRQRKIDWWPFSFHIGSKDNLFLVQASQNIYFSSSKDHGDSWSGPVEINADQGKYSYHQSPSFCQDGKGGGYLVYSKKLTPQELAARNQKNPKGVYLLRREKDTMTWSESVLLRDIPFTMPADFPSLLCAGNNLYLAYGGNIYRSKNRGKAWRKVLGLKNEFSHFKTVFKNSGEDHLYLIWSRQKITKKGTGIFGGGQDEGVTDIVFTKSTKEGSDWTRDVRVNDQQLPFVWKMSTLRTTGTEMQKYLSQETQRAVPLDMAVSESGGITGIIWKDWRSGKGKMYFSYSLDGGKSFSANREVNDRFSEEIQDASLAIADDGTIHILWTNLRPQRSIPLGFAGDVELFYSKGKIK